MMIQQHNSEIALTLAILIFQLFSTLDATQGSNNKFLNSYSRERNAGSTKEADLATERYGFSNNRWNQGNSPSTSENEIENDLPPKGQHKSQENYVCGRAIANKKYKDLLKRDQSYQLSVNRAKYRPTEIRMPRIIGGDETAPGEFPWAASVKLNGQPICGGSIIDNSWILTAAHCVVGYNPRNLTVRLGAYRIKDASETQTIDLPVSMFIVHKEYSMPRPFSNDIALLKLNEPVEFTDYIIPICLPIEDRVTTSTSSIIVNDYSNRYETSKETEDSGGIVISTKMSDNDIAKCFNRLEQNYLNSIGLGAISESTTEQSHLPTGLPAVARPSAPPPLPQTSEPQQAASAHSSVSHQLFSYGNLIDPIFMATNDGNNNNNKEQKDHPYGKVTFTQHSHQLKPIIGGRSNSQQQQQQYGLSSSFPVIDASSLVEAGNYDPDANYIYYPGMPWAIESSSVEGDDSARKETVKLSRLPISKEILREIQSVGSGQLPTLNFGIQQGDFVAMASDLTQSGSSNDGLVSVGYGSSDVIGGSGSTANNGGTNGAVGRREQIFSNRHIIRSAMEEDTDDPTKYSGLSGTVVGWGWVREFDGEDPINSKGYPSVTLQKVKLPILRNNVCEAWFQSQAKKITLLPSQFCAGFSSGGKDACRGDSGGPMIIEDNSDTGRYKLIGIVSAGIGCARPSLPGLYTRVASFLPWINAQMVRY